MVTALTAQGMTIMRWFVMQVMIANKQTTHSATQYSLNKQQQTMYIVTPSGDQCHGSSGEVFLV